MFFVGLLLLRGAFVSSQPELVDRIVAIIDRDVVTLSEAEQAVGFLELRGVENIDLADVPVGLQSWLPVLQPYGGWLKQFEGQGKDVRWAQRRAAA